MFAQLQNAVVFITGASSGIGRATARAFAGAGSRLLLCARRIERLEELRAELEELGASDVRLMELDVRDRDAVESELGRLPEQWSSIDLLVNNAGLSRGLAPLQAGLVDDWEEMIDTNVKGLLYVTRGVTPRMVARGRGHVINIGSIAGHELYPGGNVYCGTKHAVRAITKGMQMDLLGTGVRVTTIDPGMVETEFSVVRFHGDAERADAVYRGMTPLTPEDVAEAILWAAARPHHVSVHEMILMPTAQASATMVHREAGA